MKKETIEKPHALADFSIGEITEEVSVSSIDNESVDSQKSHKKINT